MRLPNSFRSSNSTGFDSPAEDLQYSKPRHLDEPLPSPLFSHPPNFARPRPSHSQLTPPKTTSRRQSFMRQNDLSARPIAENARDSISSNGSWMKRLSSIRPLSQHGSPRSSIVSQLPPNKLVKRGTSDQSNNTPATLSRRGSRSQVLSLRRPATSHQRSATLQQFQAQGGFSGPPQAHRFSLDQQLRPKEILPALEVDSASTHRENVGWTSFFHSRAIKRIGRGSFDSPSVAPGPNKRVQLPFGGKPRAYLVKASTLITGTAVQPEEAGSRDDYRVSDDSPGTKDGSPVSTDETPTKRARRSISMHFASPTTWISKTGSIRRSKRGSSEAKLAGKRNVSDPTTVSPIPDQPEPKASVALAQIFISHQPRQQLEPESASNYHPKARKRNSSSPLPPLSRLSSFNVDVSRVGLTTSSSSPGSRRPSHAPATLSAGAHIQLSMPQSRAVSGERASTVVSSDFENLFTSGDDDDTDGRSDTMYDSFRTGTSARLRTVETPLESMFDESPPSTAGNSRTKRLSIQEILGQSWDVDTNIMEEDESISTPIRASHSQVDIEMDDRRLEESSSFDRDMTMAHIDFARMSLEDDDDDDWARDDDNALSNHLSPPTSSLNSRRASPNLRHALASISGNSSADRYPDTLTDRPRSNIFDWSEPVSQFEVDGHSPRPKTVHGKQELDLRGGRPANRKGPVAAHVRSQSVPVVPDPSETSKIVPKFGTWGMGSKNVSEDWDEDFDLGEDIVGPVGGKDSATSFSMVVPPSIQAIQNTVKVHSGQIRELSLLVNDLKRLCRHGKDLDILDGSSAAKWREAENIIELAAPDDDEEEDDLQLPTEQVDELEASSIDERFLDEGFDASSLERKPSYNSFIAGEPEISKTAVVRERQLVRRRSVFSPEDDIFGTNWPLPEENGSPYRPRTPDQSRSSNRDSAMISIVMEAMQQQRAAEPVRRRSPVKPSQSKLFFDTNSLQELVKRASHLRDSLSDIVRRAEVLTQSPAGTPRRERHSRLADGSPAFTRVFTEPPSSPSNRLPKSHSSSTVLSRTSVDSPRMQLMTVS
ncbi:hypothetical protein CONLIGDRAFT_622490 [Coniochaeta ligniaria NRRL 30616]|uniref:Uncharacterized protein n=1 Tax=Coniochaeta ligniaria NRRL 30616 TaxID=1408157 RepID=A0A1J7IVA8_9PEZI|nr:hypothetical protein CONLIGDRAFT_622490 [Coniochaeta ligniaria NRRL 30616]